MRMITAAGHAKLW